MTVTYEECLLSPDVKVVGLIPAETRMAHIAAWRAYEQCRGSKQERERLYRAARGMDDTYRKAYLRARAELERAEKRKTARSASVPGAKAA